MIFQKLALAITFSPNGLSLLESALRLKNLFGANLLLIHVGEKSSESESKMNGILSSAGIKGNELEVIWQKGDPAKVIINTCKEKKIDLLIAGALEKESLIDYYIGSVARKIVRKAPFSVLILTHPKQNKKPFQKICASVEYNPVGELTLKKAYDLAQMENVNEFILIKELKFPGLAIAISDTGSQKEVEDERIAWVKEEDEKLKVLAREMNMTNVKINTVCLYGKLGWEANNYVSQIGGDLLVVPAPYKKMSLFDRIFQHDIEYILKKLPCALLVIKNSI